MASVRIGTANLAPSECAPTSKQSSYVLSRPIKVIKSQPLFVLKYVYSKMRVICYECTVVVRICDVFA